MEHDTQPDVHAIPEVDAHLYLAELDAIPAADRTTGQILARMQSARAMGSHRLSARDSVAAHERV